MMNTNTKYAVYEKYKESGIAWLGEIPAGWDLKPLKYVSRINTHMLSEGTDPDYEFDYVDIGSVSDGSGITKTERMKFSSAPSRARRLVQKGDVIISTVRTYLRAIAPITRDAENLVVSTGFCVVSPINELKSEYCLYLLQTPFFVETVVAQSVGVSYPATNASDIANIRIPLPNVEEQKQIAAFLDKETTKIDALVEKQEQLITLLREKRQAIISYAVTRGLNPNVKMKDSGIEWLGEVPEHWEIGHLRWFISIKSGEGLSNSQFSKETLDEDSYPVIGGNGTMGYSKHFNTTQKAFAIGRVGALCGNVHFLKEKCWITDNALKISKWEGFNDSYFEYMLRAANLNQYANQSAQPLITGEQVKALPVPRLPMEEQKKIAAFLNKETTKIDTLIEKCETAIALLKERRIALIAAAVTGKIDVRNAV